jgi:hypothetical protein
MCNPACLPLYPRFALLQISLGVARVALVCEKHAIHQPIERGKVQGVITLERIARYFQAVSNRPHHQLIR